MKSMIRKSSHSVLSTPVFTAALLSITAVASNAHAQERLFFASDVHDQEGVLDDLIDDYCTDCELYGLVGDYNTPDPNSFNSDRDDLFTRLLPLLPVAESNKVATEGNHDNVGDVFTHATGPVAGLIGNDNYDVYVINYGDFDSALSGLQSDLETRVANPNGKTLFVLSHFPLHTTRDGRASAAADIFNTLQGYGTDLDIVFLWGHNHDRNQVPNYHDEDVQLVVTPGETIHEERPGVDNFELNMAVVDQPLTFTYLNAGYVKSSFGTEPSATVVTVAADRIDVQRNGNLSRTTHVQRLGFRQFYGQGGRIVVAPNQDRRLEVFYMLEDNAIYHNWQTSPNGLWNGAEPLGGAAEQIAVGQNEDGRLEVFYVGTNGLVYHNWQGAPNSGWAGEEPMGGSEAQQIAVGLNEDDRLEVFYIGRADYQLYHQWQGAPNSGWSGEVAMGALARSLAVGQNQDMRLQVFSANDSYQVTHDWQVAPNSGWNGPVDLDPGRSARQLTVGQNKDGRLEMFYVGTNGAIYHNWQTARNEGTWSGEAPLASRESVQVAVAQNQDGRLEVFYLGTDGGIYHQWQVAPNSGWSEEAPLGFGARHDARQFAVGQNQDGHLEVFIIGTDNAVYHRWQAAPNGEWTAEELL